MVRYSLIILLVLTFFSCKEEKKEVISQKEESIVVQKNKDLDSLLSVVDTFVPNKIDLSEYEFLDNFDIDFILKNQEFSKDKKDKVVNVLLLKEYLFHLRNSNQGYDLKSMMKGNSESIINYFLENNGIDASQEFINSAVAFNILKEKNVIDKDVQNIIVDIGKEVNRINNQ